MKRAEIVRPPAPEPYVRLTGLTGRGGIKFDLEMTLEGARELWKLLDALYAGQEAVEDADGAL